MTGVFVAAAPVQEWECKLFQAYAELLVWRGQVGVGQAPSSQADCIKNGFLGWGCSLVGSVFE